MEGKIDLCDERDVIKIQRHCQGLPLTLCYLNSQHQKISAPIALQISSVHIFLSSESGRLILFFRKRHAIILYFRIITSARAERSALVTDFLFHRHVDNLGVSIGYLSPSSFPNYGCRSFIAGGVAACGAVTVTHGFETVKIR